MVVWITGLSGSGKTTISRAVYKEIKADYPGTVLLDGDIIRRALNNSYGYSLEERLRGAKQVAGLCEMLDREGLNVVCATMSLFNEIQASNRKTFSSYLEVYLDVEMEVLFERDQKQLYSKALAGKEKNVMGVDLPYEKPINPELCLKNNKEEDLNVNIQEVLEATFNMIGSNELTSVGGVK